MMLLLALPCLSASFPAAEARVVDGAVITWDGDRTLGATDIATGVVRWTTELPVRPYGWQPIGVLGDAIVTDTRPTLRVSANGTMLGPVDAGTLERCAVVEHDGASLLSCMDGYVLLDPAGSPIGPTFPKRRTRQEFPGGQHFYGYQGPDGRPIGRVGALDVVYVVYGEDAGGATQLAGVDTTGVLRWKVPTPGALDVGRVGDTCWWSRTGGATALDCETGRERWRAEIPGLARVEGRAEGLFVQAAEAAMSLACPTGAALWSRSAVNGEIVVLAGGKTSVVDEPSGELRQRFVGQGPARVRVLSTTGDPAGELTLRQGEHLFHIPDGLARISDRGALTLYDGAARQVAAFNFGGESNYFTLAADEYRVVLTLFDRTFVVDRARRRELFRLDGQYHTLWLGGGTVVLHRPPLGVQGDVVIRR